MKISAHIFDSETNHRVTVRTNDHSTAVSLPAKSNGGELLFLALATCFCNDLYREAEREEIRIKSVEVDVEGEFGAEGAPIGEIRYRTDIHADASADTIRRLAMKTDTVAEIGNTLRAGARVVLKHIGAVRDDD